jgi:hypothetical protein
MEHMLRHNLGSTVSDRTGRPLRTTENAVGILFILAACLIGGCGGYKTPPRPFKSYSDRLISDQMEFYRPEGLLGLGIAGGAAAVMANTSVDEDLYDTYQRELGDSKTLDDLTTVAYRLGDGGLLIPAMVIGHMAARVYLEGGKDSWIGRWTEHSLRGYLVGAAPLLVAQYAGGSRPEERNEEDAPSSLWNLGSDTNAASGHAFIGAVPFITAAKMTDSLPAKLAWYTLSALPAWSRMHDRAHFPSQVMLGWALAYFSAEAVWRTESDQRVNLAITPVSGGVLVSLGYRF